MITTITLAVIAIIIAAILLTVLGTVGAGLLLLFGDVIVFALIVTVIIKITKIFKRKK